MSDRQKPAPEPRDRYPHFIAVTTRLMDNDLYNHVNNATYYSFIDTTVTAYLAAILGLVVGITVLLVGMSTAIGLFA